MKKLTLIFAAIILMALNSNAQNHKTNQDREGGGLQLGLKLGTNYSNIYDTKGEEFQADGKFGLVGGAFVTVPIGNLFGFNPEFLFSQKGFKASSTILGQTFNFTRTSNYIDIPLLFALKPVQSVTILAGPQYSFLIKQKDTFSNSTNSVEQEQVFDNNNIRKNTLCFTGGFDVNINYIVISARAGWDMQNNKGDGTSTNPRYKNVWYQFTLGYRLYN
jgi:hypothetical protein